MEELRDGVVDGVAGGELRRESMRRGGRGVEVGCTWLELASLPNRTEKDEVPMLNDDNGGLFLIQEIRRLGFA